VDKLLEDGRSNESISERKKAYYNLQETMDDDNTAVFLYFPFNYIIKRK
jgi:ABC-type transport system substrate-binding protein